MGAIKALIGRVLIFVSSRGGACTVQLFCFFQSHDDDSTIDNNDHVSIVDNSDNFAIINNNDNVGIVDDDDNVSILNNDDNVDNGNVDERFTERKPTAGRGYV